MARGDLPDDLRMRAFTVAEARDRGITRGRIRRIPAPFSGVRTPALEIDVEQRARALALTFAPGIAFTARTAAALWGLPLPRHVETSMLDVSSPRPRRAVRRPGVRGVQRSPLIGVELLRGIPVVSAGEAWASLGGTLDLADLTAIADWVIADAPNRPHLATRAQLEGTLDLVPRRGGLTVLRRALADAREGSWSRPETLLRLALLRAGIPEPELNVTLHLDGVDLPPDLAWPEFRVAVEFDGRWHAESPGQWARDIQRRERMADAGWTVVTVIGADLFGSPSLVIARVIRCLVERGWRGARPVDLTRMVLYRP